MGKRAKTIAIDPSINMLYCTFDAPDTSLVCCGIYTCPEMIVAFFRMIRRLGVVTVVYEDCYFGRNTQTYAKAFALRERVAECASNERMRFHLVAASKWQSDLLLVKGESPREVKRNERKLRARHFARKRMGYTIGNDDFADAVCIYYYAKAENYEKRNIS